VHFKELFALDGKPTNIEENDLERRTTIVRLLEEWGLLNIIRDEDADAPGVPMKHIKVVSFRDKSNWKLISKYTIGNVKHT
jgi:hypothetical protein